MLEAKRFRKLRARNFFKLMKMRPYVGGWRGLQYDKLTGKEPIA